MPRVVDAQLRRSELVAATWQVIAAEGMDAATVRRIAEVAGCTTGRVTHWFTSKDEVLVAALREVHRRAGERMQAAGSLRDVLLEALPLDTGRLLEWRVWLAFWGRASTSGELRQEQERRYAEWRELLAGLLPPSSDDAARRTAVDLVSATIDGLGTQAALEPAAFPPERLVATVDALLVAVGEPAPPS